MNKISIIAICFIILTLGCSKKDIDKTNLTYENFNSHLTPEMNYKKIVKTFGNPEKDIGSGIHIYVYKLKDFTEIWIGYIDKITYAKHLDTNQQELHILIE